MVMAAVIHKKGAPDNFGWEEIKVGAPERGQVCLRSTAIGVNFADKASPNGHPHGCSHRLICKVHTVRFS